ncbi:hypothetical protein B2J69_03930 [Pantoea latae]|uniref:Uncharacterized protein n=1 Tax=Pantoea latae TaxID=1964541 RepID=A0A1V9DP77_9GAMM|nr:hypothetical protein B2J69_03930 [Pantoea latae]
MSRRLISVKRGRDGQKSKASRDRDKNVGNVFEQRSALARLRAHLREEVRIRAGRASMDALSDFAIGPSHPREHLAKKFTFYSATTS